MLDFFSKIVFGDFRSNSWDCVSIGSQVGHCLWKVLTLNKQMIGKVLFIASVRVNWIGSRIDSSLSICYHWNRWQNTLLAQHCQFYGYFRLGRKLGPCLNFDFVEIGDKIRQWHSCKQCLFLEYSKLGSRIGPCLIYAFTEIGDKICHRHSCK